MRTRWRRKMKGVCLLVSMDKRWRLTLLSLSSFSDPSFLRITFIPPIPSPQELQRTDNTPRKAASPHTFNLTPTQRSPSDACNAAHTHHPFANAMFSSPSSTFDRDASATQHLANTVTPCSSHSLCPSPAAPTYHTLSAFTQSLEATMTPISHAQGPSSTNKVSY